MSRNDGPIALRADEAPPLTAYQNFLMGQVEWQAGEIVRLQQAIAAETQRLALRVLALWEVDRRAEAEKLAAGLARRPERVATQLRQTLHGARWLIERWEALIRALDGKGYWTHEEHRRALNLLGVP